jgi:glycosyltransferase involved in cell wall biosynthesis
MKKILFLYKNVDPVNTPKEPGAGDGFYTYGFGNKFARNFKNYYPEYEVEVWRLDAYAREYSEKEINGILIKVFPAVMFNLTGEFSLKFLIQLRKEIKKNKPLLFVTHIHYWLLYQVLIFFKNSPIVTSHHGELSPFFKIRKRKGLRKIKDYIDTKIEKRYLKHVDYFLVCDRLEIQYVKKAAADCKIIMSSTGVNMDIFIPIDKTLARKRLGWDLNKKYLLYVGKMYDIKQTKEMVEIWKEIKTEYPEVELVIIGNRKSDEFHQFAVDSGALVLGRILNDQLGVYYSASDAYVLLVLRDDYFGGTGIAPLESLACNTPVVSFSMRNYIGNNASEICEIPDSIEGYKESIMKVLKNPNAYKNMHESIAEHYSYRKIADKMMKVFTEINERYK